MLIEGQVYFVSQQNTFSQKNSVAESPKQWKGMVTSFQMEKTAEKKPH